MAGGFRKCGLFLPRLRLLFSFKTSPSGSRILPGSQERGTDPGSDALRVGKPNPVPVNPGPKMSETAFPGVGGGGEGGGRTDQTQAWGPPSGGGERAWHWS